MSEFKQDVLETYEQDVTLLICYMAKLRALGEVEKTLMEHYGKLWSYVDELRDKNKRSTFKITTHRLVLGGPLYLKEFYIFYEACREGWKRGCNPVIGIDGCFFKGFIQGELLTAIARDGNNQMFPIAWAVVDKENTEMWTWFLGLLLEDLNISEGGGYGLTIISDKQKGLCNAVSNLLPMDEHRQCARHIYANFRKIWTSLRMRVLFLQAQKSYTYPDFIATMEQIKEKDVEAYTYLMEEQNPTTYVWAYQKNDKF